MTHTEQIMKKILADFPQMIKDLEQQYKVKLNVEKKELKNYWFTFKLTSNTQGMGLQHFVNDFSQILKTIQRKYDFYIEIEVENIRTKNNNFSSIITIHYYDNSFEQVEFDRYCHKFGFKPEDFHMTFWIGDKDFSLLKFRPRASKEPCIALSMYDMGFKYVFPVDVVKGKIPHNGPLKYYHEE